MKWSTIKCISSQCSLTSVVLLIQVTINTRIHGAIGQMEPVQIQPNTLYNKHSLLSMEAYKKDFDYEDATQVLHPEFVNSLTNVTTRAGGVATLPCAVRNLGTKKVVWRRLYQGGEHMVLTVGDFVWTRDDNITVEYRLDPGFVTHWNLRLRNVQQTDEGTYECQITDKDVIRWHVHLVVQPKRTPISTVHMSGSQYVDSGESIRLTCNATGGLHIPEDIDWFKDGTKISMKGFNPELELTSDMYPETHSLVSELHIKHADLSDSGNYICRSSDRKIDSVKVTVLIAPDSSNVKRGTGSLKRKSYATGCTPLTTPSRTMLALSSILLILFNVLDKPLN